MLQESCMSACISFFIVVDACQSDLAPQGNFQAFSSPMVELSTCQFCGCTFWGLLAQGSTLTSAPTLQNPGHSPPSCVLSPLHHDHDCDHAHFAAREAGAS